MYDFSLFFSFNFLNNISDYIFFMRAHFYFLGDTGDGVAAPGFYRLLLAEIICT